MSDHTVHRIGGGLAAGLVAVGAVGVIQAVFGQTADTDSRAVALSCIPLIAASSLMLWHRPRLPITWALSVMAAAWTLTLFESVLKPIRDGDSMASHAVDLAVRSTWPLMLPMIAVVLTLYPQAPTTRFGRALLATELSAIAITVLTFATRADGGDPAWLFHVDQVALILLLGCAVVAVGRLIVMWRRSTGRQRAQLSLVLATGLAIVLLYVVGGLISLAFGVGGGEPTGVEALVTTFLLVGALPSAIAVALLRHHLYGVDLVVNRILVWTVLIGLVIGLGTLTAVLAGDLLGRTEPDPVLVVLPCILVAVAAVPLRRAVQRGADVLIPAVDQEREAFRQLAHRLDAAVPVDEVPALVAEGFGVALDASGVRVYEDTGEGQLLLAEWGEAAAASPPSRIELRHAGSDVGAIEVWPVLSRRHQARFDALSTHAAVALQASRLTRDLERSRERLISSREVERGRLRQDLHDELSPSLAGIRLALAAARTNGEAPASDSLLARAQQEAGDAVEVIRRILEDLRPPALDDQSLADAVRLRAHSLQRPGEFDISVTIGTLPDRLPPTTEVAAYRIASEALANAARHSGARLAEVEVGVRDGSLELCVRDNGVGLAADHRLGVGLLSMRDRAEALGGSLIVEPNTKGGTNVAARLPLIATNGLRP